AHTTLQFPRLAGHQYAVRFLVERLAAGLSACRASVCGGQVAAGGRRLPACDRFPPRHPCAVTVTLGFDTGHDASLEARAMIEDFARPGEPDLRALRMIDDMFQR